MISVAIVGVLVALLAPSLAGVQASAHESVMLSQLRQHAAVFHQYTGDYGDRFPHFASATSYTVLRSQLAGVATPIRYFEQGSAWPVALADGLRRESCSAGLSLALGKPPDPGSIGHDFFVVCLWVLVRRCAGVLAG
jgi:hypothetical protein